MTSPAQPTGQTVAELGEFALIDRFMARFKRNEAVFLGPGDDAAILRARRGHVVIATDMMVEGSHFRLDWSSASDVGHRVAAQNLADIVAMGARPLAVTVALGLPGHTRVQWADELLAGIAAEAEPLDVSIIGGDLTESEQVVVSVTAVGECAQTPVSRAGAQVGDQVALAGRQGWAAGGLAVLQRGFRSPRVLVQAHQRPTPPYQAGIAAAEGGATAMTDVSDGLIADLGHVAAASKVAINVERASLEVPEPLHAVGAAVGLEPVNFVLFGGEDHGLVATFPPSATLPEGFRRIGTVLAGTGITLDGDELDSTQGGFEHLRPHQS